jgi:hypothetical protein
MNPKTTLNICAAAALLVAGNLTTRVSAACSCPGSGATIYRCSPRSWGSTACYPVPGDSNSFYAGWNQQGQPTVGVFFNNNNIQCAYVQDDSDLGCAYVDTTQGTSHTVTHNCMGASTYSGFMSTACN